MHPIPPKSFSPSPRPLAISHAAHLQPRLPPRRPRRSTDPVLPHSSLEAPDPTPLSRQQDRLAVRPHARCSSRFRLPSLPPHFRPRVLLHHPHSDLLPSRQRPAAVAHRRSSSRYWRLLPRPHLRCVWTQCGHQSWDGGHQRRLYLEQGTGRAPPKRSCVTSIDAFASRQSAAAAWRGGLQMKGGQVQGRVGVRVSCAYSGEGGRGEG